MFENPFMQFDAAAMRKLKQALNTVWALIALNVLVFIMCNEKMEMQLALISDVRYFRPWQLITYMFVHGNFSHLFFNMWGLYIFGRILAPILGREKFLILYFASGIVGGLLQLAATWNSLPLSVTVGASGALFGVMMGVAMTRPNTGMFILFFPVPVKIRTLIVIYALLEIFSQWGLKTNIAHLAHLGGFLGAYLYMVIFCRKDVVWSLKNLFQGNGSRARSQEHFDREAPKKSAAGSSGSPEPHITNVPQAEVDRLLDKISEHGINSLTDYERAELQFFREKMKNSGR